jgi:hypothetical protein
LLLPVSAVPAVAGTYQASIDANVTAFNPPCDPDPNPFVPKMKNAAVAAYARLGHVATGFTAEAFTGRPRWPGRRATGATTSTPRRLLPELRRPALHGFREDSGDCAQSVVFSKDIKAKRSGRQSNLVFISTCDSANAGAKSTTMPDAFAIAKTKTITGNQGRSSTSATSASAGIPTSGRSNRFWNGLAAKKSVGGCSTSRSRLVQRPELRRRLVGHVPLVRVAGPWTTCPTCS